jgi:hypothetical protein
MSNYTMLALPTGALRMLHHMPKPSQVYVWKWSASEHRLVVSADFSLLKLSELKDLAKIAGLKNYHTLRKAELADAIYFSFFPLSHLGPPSSAAWR